MSRLRNEVADACWPALLATKLGQELDVPQGSMWYPGLARSITQHARNGVSRPVIVVHMRRSLGLPLDDGQLKLEATLLDEMLEAR